MDEIVEYHVTGLLVNGKRFKCMVYKSWQHANMINLFNGTVWAVKANGRRTIVRRVTP